MRRSPLAAVDMLAIVLFLYAILSKLPNHHPASHAQLGMS
jgi:hypothetical protein